MTTHTGKPARDRSTDTKLLQRRRRRHPRRVRRQTLRRNGDRNKLTVPTQTLRHALEKTPETHQTLGQRIRTPGNHRREDPLQTLQLPRHTRGTPPPTHPTPPDPNHPKGRSRACQAKHHVKCPQHDQQQEKRKWKRSSLATSIWFQTDTYSKTWWGVQRG